MKNLRHPLALLLSAILVAWSGFALELAWGAPIIHPPGHTGATVPAPANPGDDNKVLRSLAGTTSWAFVANANVATAAAIAGTKISPNFGAQNVLTTGNVNGTDVTGSNEVHAGSVVTSAGGMTFGTSMLGPVAQFTTNLVIPSSTGKISLGSPAAVAGIVRVENALTFNWRNAANSADVQALAVTAGDLVQLGASGGGNVMIFDTASIGATPATAGTLRLPNAFLLAARNAANSANHDVLSYDSSDRTIIGSTSGGDVRLLNSGGSFRLRDTGTWTTVSPQNLTVLPASTSLADAGDTIVSGAAATGSGQTSTAGFARLAGAEASGTGAAFTFTGGRGELVGGNASGTGGGGTYLGGDVWIYPGEGETLQGNTFFGSNASPNVDPEDMQLGFWFGEAATQPGAPAAAGFFMWGGESGIPSFMTGSGGIVTLTANTTGTQITESMSADTTDGDLEDVGTAAVLSSDAVERNFAELRGQLNGVIQTLQDRGLML